MGLLHAVRPRFLLLTPVCVLAGLGTALHSGGSWRVEEAVLVMVAALAAHAAVNAFNEYEDFRSGLDAMTERTPFSGGSGLLPRHPEYAPMVLALAILMLLIVVTVGLWFLWQKGLGILPVGVAGLVLVLAYTRYLTRRPLLCLWAPGVGVGLLMVIGTDRILSGSFSIEAFSVGIVICLLASNLLLLNQFPDVEADRMVGRNHILIRYGYESGARVFLAQMLAAFGVLVIAVVVDLLPMGVLTGLLMLPAGLWCARRVMVFASQPERLHGAMAVNVAINVLTPLLVTFGLFVS